MYSVYWNGECVQNGLEKKYKAFLYIRYIILNNHAIQIKKGTDNNNYWYIIKFIDEDGNPSYEAMSIIKDNKENKND